MALKSGENILLGGWFIFERQQRCKPSNVGM